MLTCCDSSIRIWESNSSEQPIPVETPLKYVNTVKYLDDNRVLVSGGRSSVIYFTDVYTRIQRQYDFEESNITYITANKDSTVIVVGFQNGKISLLRYPNFKILESYKVHDFPVICLSYDAKFESIYSADDHGHVYVYKDGKATSFFKSGARNGVIRNFSISPNGENLAVSSGKSLRVYNLETGDLINLHDIGAIATCNFSPVQENVIVMGTNFGDVHIFDLNQGAVVVEHQSNIPISTTAIKYDGYTFAAGHSGGVLLFDLRKSNTQFRDYKTVPSIAPHQIVFQTQDISYHMSEQGLSVVPQPKVLKSLSVVEESVDDGDYSVSKFTFKRSLQEISETKSRMSGFISPTRSGMNSTLNKSDINSPSPYSSRTRSPRANRSIVAPEVPLRSVQDTTEIHISEQDLNISKQEQTPKKAQPVASPAPAKEQTTPSKARTIDTELPILSEDSEIIPQDLNTSEPLNMFDLEEEEDEKVKKIEEIHQVKKDAHPYVVEE